VRGGAENPQHEIPDFSHDRIYRLMVPSHFSLIYLAFSSTTSPLGTTWARASCISAARSPAIRVIVRKIRSMIFPMTAVQVTRVRGRLGLMAA
jgi:hypothetical protein